MKVTIERGEKTSGLFKKKTSYQVTFLFEFTDEEKAIVKKKNLSKVAIYDYPSDLRPDEIWTLDIGKLFEWKQHRREFSTPIEAQNWEEEFKGHLKNVKTYIDESAKPTQKSETFEL